MEALPAKIITETLTKDELKGLFLKTVFGTDPNLLDTPQKKDIGNTLDVLGTTCIDYSGCDGFVIKFDTSQEMNSDYVKEYQIEESLAQSPYLRLEDVLSNQLTKINQFLQE